MNDTVTVRRGGSYLTIPAGAIDRYKAKGYDVVDDNGNVLDASIPNDVNILKRAYEQHIAEIARLKEEIARLKEKPVPVKKVVVEPTVVEEPKFDEEVVTEKKTTKRSRKSV